MAISPVRPCTGPEPGFKGLELCLWELQGVNARPWGPGLKVQAAMSRPPGPGLEASGKSSEPPRGGLRLSLGDIQPGFGGLKPGFQQSLRGLQPGL